MNRISRLGAVAAIAVGVGILPALAPQAGTAQAQASAFTYQGRLSEGSTGINAPSARIQFILWDAQSGGSQIGSVWVSYPVEITGGIFTTLVDFGAAAFDGDSRWLEIGVDVEGGTNYTLMQPRHRVTAAPMAVHALRGGDNPWTITGSNISYTNGWVGVGTASPATLLTVAKDANSNIVPMAHLRTTGTNSTASLRFENGAGNHFNLGITAANDMALGYNANVPLSGDLLRITSSGDVGIGRLTPASKLDVNGTVRMTGFRLGESATDGYVLTTDAAGIGTWQPAPTGGGGDCYWTGGSGGRIYYNDGNVGIGVNNPTHPLYVFSATGDGALKARIDAAPGIAIEGVANAATGDVTGVYGSTSSPSGIGVRGNCAGGTGVRATSASGTALSAYASAETGQTYGVHSRVNSPTGYSGYFLGGRNYFAGHVGIGNTSPSQKVEIGNTSESSNYLRLTTAATGYSGIQFYDGEGSNSGMIQYSHDQDYMRFYTRQDQTAGERIRITSSGDVGIGTTAPAAKLDVNGTARVNGFQLGSSATAGYVLTTNASGVGTWQAPTGGGGFSLPYDGEVSVSGSAFKVTNTHATGYGIHGVSDDRGVYGFSATGEGVSGTSNSGIGVRGQAYSTGGVAVKGDVGSSDNSTGGWFEAGASTGKAVYALASGGGKAVVAEASGTSGIAVDATSSNIGLKATGGQAAAEFYGNLKIYEHGTTNLVLELGKGLDYAEGFNVSSRCDRVGPGTVLVIDAENPGELAISTRAYDRRVAGIVSGARGLGAGVRLGGGSFDHDVALAGRVYCNVVAGAEPIQPGDLLTTSHVPGHAMKVADAAASQGAILGKAMEPLAAGQSGTILVLVTLQ